MGSGEQVSRLGVRRAADVGCVGYKLAVLRLASVCLHCERLVADVLHFVNAVRFGKRLPRGVVVDKGSAHGKSLFAKWGYPSLSLWGISPFSNREENHYISST